MGYYVFSGLVSCFVHRNVTYGARFSMFVMFLTRDYSPFPEMRNPEWMCSSDDPSPI